MITREQATATLADFEAAGLDGRIPDLARTVVALHDEVERLRSLLGDMHVDAAGLAEEAASLTTRLRLAEASVSLLRADVADREGQVGRLLASVAEANTEASDLRLELRRLRAAESPGTDDEAFEGTGWRWDVDAWLHAGGRYVVETGSPTLKWGWADDSADDTDDTDDARDFRFALDAMRAAVPGSV